MHKEKGMNSLGDCSNHGSLLVQSVTGENEFSILSEPYALSYSSYDWSGFFLRSRMWCFYERRIPNSMRFVKCFWERFQIIPSNIPFW